MSKEKFALEKIREILADGIDRWDRFNKNPTWQTAASDWIDYSLSKKQLIEIFTIIKINDMIVEEE